MTNWSSTIRLPRLDRCDANRVTHQHYTPNSTAQMTRNFPSTSKQQQQRGKHQSPWQQISTISTTVQFAYNRPHILLNMPWRKVSCWVTHWSEWLALQRGE